jgi:hypothetical protein
MSAHELLQRRVSSGGGSVWAPSPLLLAATRGELAILDGIHRLPRGVLAAALAPLLADRSIPTLPDGRRLLAAEHYAQLAAAGWSGDAMLAAGVAGHVHPSFRLVAHADAEGEPRGLSRASSGWLVEELMQATCMHVLRVPLLTRPEVEEMLLRLHALPQSAHAALTTLLRYDAAVSAASATEPSLSGARLTNRQLVRAAAFLAVRPADDEGALRRATHAALLALPPAARATASQLLQEARANPADGSVESVDDDDRTLRARALREQHERVEVEQAAIQACTAGGQPRKPHGHSLSRALTRTLHRSAG